MRINKKINMINRRKYFAFYGFFIYFYIKYILNNNV